MRNRTWVILFVTVIVLCAGASWMLLQPGEEAARAEIWSEGKLVHILDLRTDQSVTIQNARGSNIVTVQDGKIAVTEADCPDGYCMQRGFCSGGADIVCLPNRLVICFVGEQSVDAVIG